MRTPPLLLATLLISALASAQSAPPVRPATAALPSAQVICVQRPIACAALVPLTARGTVAARERRRAEHDLAQQPTHWGVIYLIVPPDAPQALDELNQLLNQLARVEPLS